MMTKTPGISKKDSKERKSKESAIPQIAESAKMIPITVTDRFVTDTIKGSGFTFNQTICEFTDNALDAGAKNITIEATKLEDGSYNIRIEDDGAGIPKEKIAAVLSELGHGSSDDYNSGSISNYGVGMKFAIINLVSKGTAIIESRRDGWKSTVGFQVGEKQAFLTEPTFVKDDGKPGTTIYLPSVTNNRSKITSHQITGLVKHFGATYYPHVSEGGQLSITIINDKNKHQVEFTDPLYRYLGEDKGIISNYDECEIEGRKVYLKARMFLRSFDEENLNSFDCRQGGPNIATRKGIYFRLNGRYITLAAPFSILQDRFAFFMDRIRIEVDIDRDLIPIMGVGFNKSKITIDKENALLNTFIARVDDIMKWAEKIYKKETPPSKATPIEREERDKINKTLSALSKRTNGDGLKELFPSMSSSKKDKEDPKGTKNRPSGLEYNKLSVEVCYEALGAQSPAFEYGRLNGKTVISLNTEHAYYAAYCKLPEQSKMTVDMMMFSMIEGLVATKLDHIGEEADAFRQDFVYQMSMRMAKWFKQQQ